MPRRLFLMGWWLLANCGPPLPERPDGPAGADGAAGSNVAPHWAVSVVPPSPLAAAARVLRLRVDVPAGVAAPDDVALFRGELSDYHLARLDLAELPGTLLERRVEVETWVESEPSVVVLAPVVALEPGERYSLISRQWGLVGTVTVRGEQLPPTLLRTWPPAESGCGASQIVFCGGEVMLTAPVAVTLDPGRVPAVLAPGVEPGGLGATHCAHLRTQDPLEPGTTLMPPPQVSGVALDPAPLRGSVCAPPSAPECADPLQPFALGCAEVQDDRVIVTSPTATALWVVGGEEPMVEVLAPGSAMVVRGLTPEALQTVDVAVVDEGGRVQTFAEEVRSHQVLPHVVINEVLANAAGPEPQQEWVELYNDGAVAVELQGWVLEDVGGQTELPAHRLLPGGYAVVVNEQFTVDPELDVPPAADAALLRVPRLGKQGLSNAGELLRLRAPDGTVVSRFPALPHAADGISGARRYPWSPSEDLGAFDAHAAPGASPGAANQLE